MLVNELNSADDNPIIDPEGRTVIHGGNFHGDYVSFEMDKLKIAVTKMTMLTERQMNYLFHDRINGILPPFVNLGVPGRMNYSAAKGGLIAATKTLAQEVAKKRITVYNIFISSFFRHIAYFLIFKAIFERFFAFE